MIKTAISMKIVRASGNLVGASSAAAATLVAAALLTASTPIPALGQVPAGTTDWQARALQKYPDLGRRDSTLNQQFVGAVLERRRTRPAFFSDPRWPLLLADELMLAQPAVASAPSDAPQANAPAAVSPVPAPSTAEFDAGTLPGACGLVSARFRWWSPPGVSVRGVLVLLAGRNGDSRAMVDQADWQALAARARFGLMGSQLVNPATDLYTFQGDPNGMISDLIGKAVDALLLQTGQHLKDPPLAFWGHSAGGNLTQQYMSRHANRVVGAVLMRATDGPGGLAPGKDRVPTLICVGGKDKPDWVKAAGEAYERGHRTGAEWTLALNPREGHEVGQTQPLAVAYLAAAINLRLPEPTGIFAREGGGSGKLVQLTRQSAWLGNPVSYEVAAYEKYTGKKSEAVWLPDENTARVWQEYLGVPAEGRSR